MIYNNMNICFEMVAWTYVNGKINPARFRFANKDESISVIKVDKVITVDKEKLAGNHMLIYKCQGVTRGTERLYEIEY